MHPPAIIPREFAIVARNVHYCLVIAVPPCFLFPIFDFMSIASWNSPGGYPIK